jgi:phage tail-like protein
MSPLPPLPPLQAHQTAQRLPSYLPAIYREQPFVGQYLWAFEQVLLDLEQQIGSIASIFDPQETREEFLPWLSSWVAFTLRQDLDTEQQRRFLARIIPLYRRRGTLKNLQDLLSIFTTGVPAIVESSDPHHFHATLRHTPAEPDELLREISIAHALIDLEKPAHTFYDVDFLFPTMQIGVTSHIGVDTLLGTIAAAAATLTSTREATSTIKAGLATPSHLAASASPTDSTVGQAKVAQPKVSHPKASHPTASETKASRSKTSHSKTRSPKAAAESAASDVHQAHTAERPAPTARKKSASNSASSKSQRQRPSAEPARPKTRRRKRDTE